MFFSGLILHPVKLHVSLCIDSCIYKHFPRPNKTVSDNSIIWPQVCSSEESAMLKSKYIFAPQGG